MSDEFKIGILDHITNDGRVIHYDPYKRDDENSCSGCLISALAYVFAFTIVVLFPIFCIYMMIIGFLK